MTSENEKIIKKLKKSQAAIATERDRLGDLITDMECLRDNCENAWTSLQDAIDSLSENL